MLHSIAVCQYNLGTARGKRDPYWLKESKETHEQLVKEYPEYSDIGWIKYGISQIDEMLEDERRRERIKER